MILHGVDGFRDNYSYGSSIYRDYDSGIHFHDCYELIYTLEGYTKVTVEKTEEFLSTGEFLLVSPYTAHGFSCDSASKCWIGVFSEDFISSFADKYRDSEFTKFTCDPQIEKMLIKYLLCDGIPDHYMLTSCLYMVCNECEKNADQRESKQNSKFKSSVIEYITENLCNDITLNDVSKALGYEYHYISALFHECFCMNFKSFINLLRYEMACRMLKDKSKDMTAICNACGFGSVRNFNRVFKNMSGLTPREYRMQK